MSEDKHNLFGGTPYQPQGEIYFNDGREIELLDFMYAHPHLKDMRGNPQKVLDAIDEYGKTRKYLMNIGEYKSKTIVDLIKEEKPHTIVELGGYVGYSAIAFGAALRNIGGKHYYSLEMNPEFAAVISMLVDLAGLSDVVKVEVGPSSDSLKRLHEEGTLNHIDLLFLDHYKPAYTPDLKICEELGLVSEGSIYAADNVIKPGNPLYLQYVRSTVQEKKKSFGQIDSTAPRGNPNLIYDSQLIEGWEPSGVPDAIEITRCIGIQA
ncbi:S-adenosyl-L-methionine-dependent methyltransferase [Annulohypoxylon maeteangense]|uniref:S-adenosyl-L-methionine-dependent methyltransferase n=1 Tax=Annulohypoxylon maeteangense TaxID=1927788 RepID=UPI0020086282|nr:S-adenosyl-L-methionine-dependent methyltransferase [Annulohypoxylon maeteangense]KAI0890131.1 S-adenosyl-L-methionine-dependent methyltransferase [Annulohypoxylon maeteangense]